MRLGEVARRARVPVSTVRFYAGLGLLPERPRPLGSRSHRVFEPRAVSTVRAIRVARDLGVPLETVRRLVAPAAAPPGEPSPIYDALRDTIHALADRRQQLAEARQALALILRHGAAARLGPEDVSARIVAALAALL